MFLLSPRLYTLKEQRPYTAKTFSHTQQTIWLIAEIHKTFLGLMTLICQE